MNQEGQTPPLLGGGRGRRRRGARDDDDDDGLRPSRPPTRVGVTNQSINININNNNSNNNNNNVASRSVGVGAYAGGTNTGGTMPRPVQHFASSTSSGEGGPTLLPDDPMNDNDTQRNNNNSNNNNNRNNLNNRNLTVEQEDIKAKERARRANQNRVGLQLASGMAPPSSGSVGSNSNNAGIPPGAVGAFASSSATVEHNEPPGRNYNNSHNANQATHRNQHNDKNSQNENDTNATSDGNSSNRPPPGGYDDYTIETGGTDNYSVAVDSTTPVAAHVVPDEDEVAQRIAERLGKDLTRQFEAVLGQQQQPFQQQQQQTFQQQQHPQLSNFAGAPQQAVPAVPVATPAKVTDNVRPDNDDNDDDESNNDAGCLSFQTILIILLVFIILGAGGGAAAVFLLGGDDDDDGGDDELLTTPMPTTTPPTGSPTLRPTLNPTKVPTPAPTPAPTEQFSQRFQDLWSLIGDDIIINGNLILEDESSPQHEAFLWLADEDPAEYDFSSTSPFLLVQRYVAALLYISTEGESWPNTFRFLSGSTFCSWNQVVGDTRMGISCAGGTISDVVFIDNALVGSIPAELGLLTDMTNLDLSENILSGTIPTELFYLSNLGTFDLDENFLTGTMPTEVSNLRRTVGWFSTFRNELTGTIPVRELSLCTNLFVVSIEFNNFSGPMDSQWSRLRDLLYLGLAGNNLSGTLPSELSEMNLMRILRFGTLLELSGTVPTELGLLTDLEDFYINDNQLTGTIPTEFASLTKLTALSFRNSMVNGTVDDIFCTPPATVPPTTFDFEVLVFDCSGTDPEVVCSCCTFCCPVSGCI